MKAIIVFSIIMVLFTIFRVYTMKFYNPYTLTLIYGKKGCGKSTIAQKYIYKHYKRGWNIYYNKGDSSFPMGIAIDASRLWEVDFPPRTLLIIDEVNLLWDNRQFKTFPKELGEWFRTQRHHKVKCILFSQTADADKKIRDLTDRVYLCKRWFQVLIVCTPYEKSIEYREPKGDTPAGFMDVYRKISFGPILCTFAWLPKWVKFHDSFKYGRKEDESSDSDSSGIRTGWNRLIQHRHLVSNKSRKRNKSKKGKLHNTFSGITAIRAWMKGELRRDPRPIRTDKEIQNRQNQQKTNRAISLSPVGPTRQLQEGRAHYTSGNGYTKRPDAKHVSPPSRAPSRPPTIRRY